jgi:hypothetical protein
LDQPEQCLQGGTIFPVFWHAGLIHGLKHSIKPVWRKLIYFEHIAKGQPGRTGSEFPNLWKLHHFLCQTMIQMAEPDKGVCY